MWVTGQPSTIYLNSPTSDDNIGVRNTGKKAEGETELREIFVDEGTCAHLRAETFGSWLPQLQHE